MCSSAPTQSKHSKREAEKGVSGKGKTKQSWFRRALAANGPQNGRTPVQDPRVDWQAVEPSVVWDPWEVWLKRFEQPRRRRDR